MIEASPDQIANRYACSELPARGLSAEALQQRWGQVDQPLLVIRSKGRPFHLA
jgi:hypothetical protein